MTTQHQPAGPDPDAVRTRDDLAKCLTTLHVYSGKRSYRDLERWVATQRAAGRDDLRLTRSSVSEALTGKRLPTREFVRTFIEACEVAPEEYARWTNAWARVADDVQRSRRKDPAVAAVPAATESGSTAPAPAVPSQAGPTAAAREPETAEPSAATREVVTVHGSVVAAPSGSAREVATAGPPGPPGPAREVATAGPPGVRDISRLMQWLSGADPRILAACPRDRPRFVGLGGTVLTTAALAAVSVVFTASVALGTSIWLALAIGLGWGLVIMNTDRWMVVISHRRDRLWQNLATVLPRLVISVLLGVTISTPLVLWFFNSEIESQLVWTQAEKQTSFVNQLRQEDGRYRQIPQLEKQVNDLQKVAYGPATTQDAVSRKMAAKTQLDQANQTLALLRAQLRQQEAAYAKASAADAGILARINALNQLTSSNPALASAYYVLTILLTLIDVLPVLVKFLMNIGPPTLYDRLVARADQDDAESMLSRPRASTA
ncbi:DUF4407 domain-containing protein [Actinoplanes bogorensis]|uniref:DUF4407 domain-containing protein n=1 Tax=Paractinoplanes bogorensis TaxID=1610840 RepID=A0ABS5YYA9_9ACTN|nr:DUF4407 domain-containing protein [Actinoplanes bogorensis]MBU2668378.1 DUF4407 domain-containing protein [Actinoplanes bogorensis]